ncbi:hypothetical protein DM860_001429 [Cuscuta australis]|uniref:Uncharacterized protein n=1 Tax=Cuscuta australis TaxID=267555 RepID=A0A328ECW4_9ASTE|nr:hypothetical protein DM860_001429 [Cuscuta australis]
MLNLSMKPVAKPAHGDQVQELMPGALPFARSYQLEALEKAMKQNTIVFLETGSGKTLIAIMLLRSFGHLIRKPSPYVAIFLVPTVVLVTQQGEAIKKHTDLKVGKYWGEMGVDFWDANIWNRQVELYEVLVMTPAILLVALRHSFLKIEMIKLLIFDECHNARGKHPYSCIMREFYHCQLQSINVELPRIFGMTASPIKAKGSSSGDDYWIEIGALENLMNSKVYTCASDSVLAAYIPFPTSKVRTYHDIDVPSAMFGGLHNALHRLKDEREKYITEADLSEETAESVKKRLSKLLLTFLYCLTELGVFLAFKAAESLSCEDKDIFKWGTLSLHAETIIRGFSLDAAKIFSAQMPNGAQSYVSNDLQAGMDAGYLTSKVLSLVEILLDYRPLKDLRCIIFVERVITAIVLPSLLNEVLPKLTGWQTKYTAGNASRLQAQSRTIQNTIVDEFRKGTVNIIVATSILEEGLDVQSCNLVIRFDPSATVSSFIQSRGRARMQNSHFISLVRSGDKSTLDRVTNYLASGEIMRKESLSHASQPCSPLHCELYDEYSYKVEATGAVVNLRSSVSLLNLYCSRLPSDQYFAPSPRYDIDKDAKTCVLHLPKSCHIKKVEVQGDVKILKQLACLEACKQLHQVGALSDNLVPDIMEEKEDIQETGCVQYSDGQPRYHPPELIGCHNNDSETVFYCYLIELCQYSYKDIQLQNITLAVKMKLEFGDEKLTFELNVDGDVRVGQLFYVGQLTLTSEKIKCCRMFQVILLSALMHKDLNKLAEAMDRCCNIKGIIGFDYLILPSSGSSCGNPLVNWSVVDSVFPSGKHENNHTNCFPMHDCSPMHTKTGLVCSCRLKNSLICTPHNGALYYITDILHNLNGNSTLEMRKGKSISYKYYFKEWHDIDLLYDGEALLNGRFMPTVQNFLQRCGGTEKRKEPHHSSVELPPELCSVIMSPIPYDMLCSFTYVPSIMHRIESLLLAVNLKKMHMDHCTQNVNVPTSKFLEATTSKKCLESFHLETLETLGDSFLKYAVGQQLFTTYQNAHEGLLSLKKEKMVSNAALCKLACDRNIPGFIRTEPFDPKTWAIPGDFSPDKNFVVEFTSPARKMYSMGHKNIKAKRVADAVEALIGAYVSTVGEVAALSFMAWLGLDIHYHMRVPIERNFPISAEKFVNIAYIEKLLKYKFSDPSLLVEALTHGSFMQSDIPRCYQRLEFIGDAVLDYVITVHLYYKHPGLTPGLLTDLRSCSVNNDCYALCAVKAGLHKQLLYFSTVLQKHIADTVERVEKLCVSSTFGWESEINFPKVLGDIIESLAGAILIDSGFNKDRVYGCIIPLLEPMVTPETLTLHPVRELYELCRSRNYIMKKPSVTVENEVTTLTMEVEDGNGSVMYRDSCTAPNKAAAKKLSCKNILKMLKKT